MARRARRVLARRRRELEGLVRRGAGADFDPMAAADAALGESGIDQLEAGRSSEDDRARARNIPIIGALGGGGAIPGTLPHRQRQLDRWSGR